jgi:acetoin:2,6-dichlorophenolindophenol oxidoreductase subunit beta
MPESGRPGVQSEAPNVTSNSGPPTPGSRRLSFAEALLEGMAEEFRRDERVFMYGQDVGAFGGIMQSCSGLLDEFGPWRVRGAPISESAIVGTAIGAALFGKRPIAEVSFGEFLPCAMNQLALQAPNLHYMTAGLASVPLVIRTRVGDGPYRGHPQSYEAWFAHLPGLKVVMPSTPADAKGLIKAAIRDNNPVLFFEHMFLYHGVKDDVPTDEFLTPIGPAATRREGRDVTIAATAWMVHKSLAAAQDLSREGVEAEIIDLRTINPLDNQTVVASVRRTGRLVVAHEAWKVGGIGAEVASTVAEQAFDALKGPIVRVGAPHVPIPSASDLRNQVIPTKADVVAAVHQAVAPQPLSRASPRAAPGDYSSS